MTNSSKNNYSALYSIISVFFFWGFVAASNGVLIPVLRHHFQLSQFASQLVDFAFYIAYFVGSIIYFLWSYFFSDPFNRYGMKIGLVGGLLVSAIGAALFVLAVNTNVYMYFLIGFFLIAFGFSVLQIVANPYVINLGDPARGSFRLNLAGSINSLGTSIGPVIFGFALFGSAMSKDVTTNIGVEALKLPFMILAAVLCLVALFLYFSELPEPKLEESKESKIGALEFPQLIWGMAAIFVYVGVEVSVGSNLGALLEDKNIKGIDHTQVAKYVSLYWGSLMIGRWAGAINAFDLSKSIKQILEIIVPMFAFGVVLFFNHLREGDVSDLYSYMFYIGIFILVNHFTKEKPAKTMMIFGGMAALMMVIGICASGDVALYCFISGGLFCSVMWPCIFNLSIAGLGRYTNQGSSLLVSMILGGALIPLVQGKLSDMPSIGIQNSYWVAVICFLFLAWYGFIASRILKKQGISYEISNTGH
jgi:FHS family L-fucose permease-like MFS transporter